MIDSMFVSMIKRCEVEIVQMLNYSGIRKNKVRFLKGVFIIVYIYFRILVTEAYGLE